MFFMNYDEITGKILGFFRDDIEEHVANDITDKSVKITTDLIKLINSQSEDYKVKLDNILNIDREYILDVTDFESYFEPRELVRFIEEKVDKEKLAMAEAIADLYEQILILQGGV